MAASKYDLKDVEQGATYLKTFTWKAGPMQVPVDLTGCTARMQVRANLKSADVLLLLTTENGRITLGGVDGTISLRIEAEDTAAISWMGGVYDLEIVFADGTVRRLLQGKVMVSPEVTRD